MAGIAVGERARRVLPRGARGGVSFAVTCLLLMALAWAPAADAASPAARAAACGGLLQPACPAGTKPSTCGGLLQPACPKPAGTRAGAAPCGGLLQPACPPPAQCGNGKDDDHDGVVDMADPGCTSRADKYESDDLAPDMNGRPAPAPDLNPAASGRLFGFNSSLSSLPSTGFTAADEAQLIRNAGGNIQRVSISWARAEPKRGAYDETAMTWIDRVHAELAGRGMAPIITIIDAPAWASEQTRCPFLDFACQSRAQQVQLRLPPNDIGAYANFVAYVARRYPRAVIEPWNEPNVKSFWNSSTWPNAPRVARMQCAAFDAVRAMGSTQAVLAPGLSVVTGTGTAGHQYPYLDFVRALHKEMGRRCWDGLAIHAYPRSTIDGDGSFTALQFRIVRQVRSEFGDTTPIWVTEAGASTTGGQAGDHGHTQRSPEEQLRMLRETTNELLSSPDVYALVLHSLRDRPTDSPNATQPSHVEYGFGLLRDGLPPTPAPKPAYCHFVRVSGNTYPGC